MKFKMKIYSTSLCGIVGLINNDQWECKENIIIITKIERKTAFKIFSFLTNVTLLTI